MNSRSTSQAILTLAALAVGCGGGATTAKRPMGTLKGTLTFNGNALPEKTGLVFQHAQTGHLYLAMTDGSGRFVVEKPASEMPAGRYDVSVSPASLRDETGQKAAEEALGEGAQPSKKNPDVEIPQRYRNGHESGLSFDLMEGANEKAFDLKK